MWRTGAVELARRAARLSALVAQLAAGWARQREGLPADAGAAVEQLITVVEGEVDRLFLAAFAAAQALVGVTSSRPRRGAPDVTDYPAAARAVADELQAAAGLWGERARMRRRLAADLRRTAVLIQSEEQWQAIARRWEPIAHGSVEPYRLPPEPAGTSLFHSGNRVVINTGVADDRVSVGQDPAAGDWRVVVNGRLHRFPAGTDITIRTGPGDDHVTVSATVGVTVLGGSGNDVVYGGEGADRLYGGPGDDYLDGRGGDDLLSGGPGDDVVYGADGADVLFGGPGDDYLDGGAGPDFVSGGDGSDVVAGGTGDDVLDGGRGDDRLYPGPGRDRVDGGAGHDVAYSTAESLHTAVEDVVLLAPVEPSTAIRIVGGPGFAERVRADLQVLATSPTGQRMLAGLGGDSVVILEDTASSASMTTLERPDGRRLTVFTLTYDPSRGVTADHSPPIIGLFHELAHVYGFTHDAATGRHDDPDDPDRVLDPDGMLIGTPNDERTAVGLPIDHDGDPSTPNQIDPNHPYELTENALRDEMGRPRRQRYGR